MIVFFYYLIPQTDRRSDKDLKNGKKNGEQGKVRQTDTDRWTDKVKKAQ